MKFGSCIEVNNPFLIALAENDAFTFFEINVRYSAATYYIVSPLWSEHQTRGGMAQSVEHIVHIDGVVGSSPTVTTTRKPL